MNILIKPDYTSIFHEGNISNSCEILQLVDEVQKEILYINLNIDPHIQP